MAISTIRIQKADACTPNKYLSILSLTNINYYLQQFELLILLFLFAYMIIPKT